MKQTAMQMRGMIRKEFLQVVRDPSSIGIAFVLPVVLLLLFGYGVSLDAEHVPIALVVERPTQQTASLAGAFEQNRYFDPVHLFTLREAESAMMSRQVDGIVHVHADFDRQLRRPDGAPIQLIVNGVDANSARITTGYVQGVWSHWVQNHAPQQGHPMTIPVRLDSRLWFNPNARSRNFLVPGLIAIIMTLIGALLTALIMAREWERGTMEALMVTPISMNQILAGKVLPYFVLGMGGMTLSTLMAVWQFGVPLRGSIWVLFVGASLFLLTALGMGLLISTIAKVQFVAAQTAIIVTFLPAFILSGFIFDIGSMPWPIQIITHAIPARYFVAILQTLFLAGDVWSVLIPNVVALAIMAVVFLGLTRLLTHKRLD